VDALEAAVDTLETTVAGLVTTVAQVEVVVVGSPSSGSFTSATPTTMGVSFSVVAGRRYWFTFRYCYARNETTGTWAVTMDSTATMAQLVYNDVTLSTWPEGDYNVMVIHGYCQATTSGVVTPKLAIDAGSLAVLGSPMLTSREIA
jgi:hypothetical protein